MPRPSTTRTRHTISGVHIGNRKGLLQDLRQLFGYDRSVVVPSKYSGPLAIVGGSGSGKTAGVVLPTLCRSYRDGTFFAVDLKGDLLCRYTTDNSDKAVKVFSLRGDSEYTYEPFEHIRGAGEADLVSNMRELVNALIPLPTDSKDPFWIMSAREYLTGGLLYYFDLNRSFIDSVINMMTTPPTELILKIGQCENPSIRSFVNNFLGDTDLSDSKLLTGICQEVTNRLSVIANDPRVYNALSPSENQIQWSDLETCNIFLSVPEDRLEQYSPFVTMIITQLIRSLERRHEKHSTEGASQGQIMLMLDEFPRLGKLDVIASAVSTLRSKNVKICLVFQSLAQLDAVYGRDVRRIIIDNCSYMAVLSVNDVESQKYFADRAGTVLVERRSKSRSYAPVREGTEPARRQVTGTSEQVSATREYAIQPHNFSSLRDIVFFTPDGHTRVKKCPYHKPDPVTRLREDIRKAVTKVSDVVKNVFNKAKSFIASFLGWRRRCMCY